MARTFVTPYCESAHTSRQLSVAQTWSSTVGHVVGGIPQQHVLVQCVTFLSVCLSTVRGLIFSLQSVPYHPIDDSNGCLLAGSDVEIVCAHQAYPPATVEFFQDGNPVNVSGRR